MCVLHWHKLDLASAIASQSDSPVGYGSEFHPVKILKRVFGSHPIWFRLEILLSEGSGGL